MCFMSSSVHAKDLADGLRVHILTLVLVSWFLRSIKASDEEKIPVFFIFFIAVVITFICSVLLIVGINKNRHLLFVPWLIFAVIGLVALVGLIICGLVDNMQWESVLLWAALLFHLCDIGMIFSIYTKIRTSREEQRPENLGNLESGNFIVTKEPY